MKRILKYLLLFCCLIWVINDFSNNSNKSPSSSHSQIANSKGVTAHPTQANHGNKSYTSASSTQPTFTTLNPNSGYKWNTPNATVYIKTNNPMLIQAYKNAINAWNQTNSFKFVLTNNPQSQIICDERNLTSTKQDDGLTTSQELGNTETSYLQQAKLIQHANVVLDNSGLLTEENDKHNSQYATWVAEHELGHAIGLDHTAQNANSVMVPSNPQHGITENDIITVKQLYGLGTTVNN